MTGMSALDSPELLRLRKRMLEDYVVARGIQDPLVLRAMEKVPRHLFVDEALRERAYGDYALPIGDKQTISQPYIIARTTQALELEGGEKILEIGTGSGYQTAILSQIADHVFSLEKIPQLARRARKVLDVLGCHNVATRILDGTYGWKEEAPFDAILVSAVSGSIPEKLLDQVREGGRLVLPLEDGGDQNLVRLRNTEAGWDKEVLGPCRFVPLVGSNG
jgi:protein-L-isoaspartate(D-aspartate) O-methyltransferase